MTGSESGEALVFRSLMADTRSSEPPDVSEILGRLQATLSDRYTVERELGRGGMSIVYLARDIRHDRAVALKVLRPELTESVHLERFVREIHIAASLKHPNILPLFDSGEADGLLYYVMPCMEGDSLRDLVAREGQVSVDRALEITLEVAAALGYAHEHGVVHRDIKPENILLEADRAVVADFGIAQATTEAGGERLTGTGVSIGTPEYMSPEQASGDRNIDGRSDIYSLGTVLYEMLAGDPPFTGSTRSAIIARVISDDVPSLKVVRKNVQPGVLRAVKRSLEKVPGDRFATGEQFSQALEVARHEAVLDGTWWERYRRVLGTAAAAMAALAVVVGVWRGVWFTSTELDANRVTVFPLTESAVTTLPEGIGEVVGQLIGVRWSTPSRSGGWTAA